MAFISSLKSTYDSWLLSVSEINELTLTQFENVAEQQLDSAKYYSQLSLQQLQALPAIRGVDDLKKFASDSVGLTGTMAQKVVDDSRVVTAMGEVYRSDVLAVIKHSASLIDTKSKAVKK